VLPNKPVDVLSKMGLEVLQKALHPRRCVVEPNSDVLQEAAVLLLLIVLPNSPAPVLDPLQWSTRFQ